jgi:hypothetical protein
MLDAKLIQIDCPGQHQQLLPQPRHQLLSVQLEHGKKLKLRVSKD